MKPESIPSPFDELTGEELSAVTFVRDYVQLQFNPPPLLNVTTKILLEIDGRQYHQENNEFPKMIIAQIGKVVMQLIYRPGEYFQLVFQDGSKITASLNLDDYVGAEALLIRTKGDNWGAL